MPTTFLSVPNGDSYGMAMKFGTDKCRPTPRRLPNYRIFSSVGKGPPSWLRSNDCAENAIRPLAPWAQELDPHWQRGSRPMRRRYHLDCRNLSATQHFGPRLPRLCPSRLSQLPGESNRRAHAWRLGSLSLAKLADCRIRGTARPYGD